MIQALLARPHTAREVVGRTACGQQLAVVASRAECAACAGVMAYARGGPKIVHGPYYRLAAAQYLADGAEREHALVYPIEVYHVGLLELGQAGYVGACVGYIYLEEVPTLKVQVEEYGETFPQKVEPGEPTVRQLHHGDLVGLLLGYEHLCLDTVVVECLHKSVGCYCCATRLFASVDN